MFNHKRLTRWHDSDHTADGLEPQEDSSSEVGTVVIGLYIPRQQTLLAPSCPNVDPVSSTLGQRGPNVPCYLVDGMFCYTESYVTSLCFEEPCQKVHIAQN